MSSKANLKQTTLPIHAAPKSKDANMANMANESGDSSDVHVLSTTESNAEFRKKKGNRVKFTEEQKTWLNENVPLFYNLPHHKAHNPAVLSFKASLAEEYVKKFDFPKNELNFHRERAIRYLSNEKRKDCPGKVIKTVSEKDCDVIANFFEKERTITGRALFIREHKDLIKERTAELAASREHGKKNNRGLSSIVQKEVYDALSQMEKYEYEMRASAENARIAVEGNVDDDAIEENQNKAPDVLQRLMTGLCGHNSSWSVGDAIFHIQYAFRSPSGEITVDSLHTNFEGNLFYNSKYYKRGKISKAWKSFAKEAFGETKESSYSQSNYMASSGETDGESSMTGSDVIDNAPIPLPVASVQKEMPAIPEDETLCTVMPVIPSSSSSQVPTSSINKATDVDNNYSDSSPQGTSQHQTQDSVLECTEKPGADNLNTTDSGDAASSVSSPVAMEPPEYISDNIQVLTAHEDRHNIESVKKSKKRRAGIGATTSMQSTERPSKKTRVEEASISNAQRKSTRNIIKPQRLDLDLPVSAKNKKHRK